MDPLLSSASGLDFLENLNESLDTFMSLRAALCHLDVSVCPGSGSVGPSCCSVMFRFDPLVVTYSNASLLASFRSILWFSRLWFC